MESGFSILMFIFAALLFLYAVIMAVTKNYGLLPFKATVSVKPKHPEQYTVQLAKAIMLCAMAIAVGAAIALWNMLVGAIAIIVGMIFAIWIGTKIVKNE